MNTPEPASPAHRFYCPDLIDSLPEGTSLVTGDEAHHALHVLRLAPGAVVAFFDGRGHQARARVATTSRRDMQVQWLDSTPQTTSRAQGRLILAVALPKGPRALDLVNMLTQVDVQALLPLQSDYSVSEPGSGRQEKMRRQVIQACKQCGRDDLMTIAEPTPLDQIFATQPDALWVMLDPDGVDDALKQALAAAPHPQSLGLLIGPEGGWSDQEIQWAQDHHLPRWRIGRHLLRVETAATAAAAMARGIWI